jgi:hypothetical protein
MRSERPLALTTLAVAALAAAAAGAGCATSLSTMQPYQTLKPGGMHFGMGYSVNAPVSTSVRSVEAAVELASAATRHSRWDGMVLRDDGIDTVSRKTWAKVAAGAMAVLLNTPGLENEYMFRLGVVKDVDVGFRWAWSTARLDGKFQLYRYKPSRRFDVGLSLDVGAGYHFFDGLVFDVLDYMNIDKFRRFDAEASLIAGMSWGTYDAFQIWFGPKIMQSFYAVDGNLAGLCEPTKEVCTPDDYRLVDANDTNGRMGLYGGFFGFAVGYRWIWFVGEITAMWMVARHHLLPGILPEPTDLGGLVVFPSWGFMGRFEL